MGRAKGQPGAVLTAGFDAVLGRRRGLTSDDQQTLHGTEETSGETTAATALTPAEQELLLHDFARVSLTTMNEPDHKVLNRVLAHLNAQAGNFSDTGTNYQILESLSRKLCDASSVENMNYRQLKLSSCLGMQSTPFRSSLRDDEEMLGRAVRATHKKTADHLTLYGTLQEDEVRKLARTQCWEPVKNAMLPVLLAYGTKPLKQLLKDDVYRQWDKKTQGRFGRSKLAQYMDTYDWDVVLSDWEPRTGSDGLAQLAVKQIEEHYDRDQKDR